METLFFHTDANKPSATVVQACAAALVQGGVGCIPTDSVYGLCALPTQNHAAYDRIFTIKQRELSQTLPFLISPHTPLERFAQDIPDYAYCLAQAFWPGALTLILPAAKTIDSYYVRPDNTIALRQADCAFTTALLDVLGAPLATTSANTHALPSVASDKALEQAVVSQCDVCICAGKTRYSKESTIVACTKKEPVFVRIGALSQKEILGAI